MYSYLIIPDKENTMEDITYLFRENENDFTIYVIEQRFAIGRGLDYFKSFKGKSNYIDTDELAKKRLYKIRSWIEKKIPSLAELIKIGFVGVTPASIVDIVTALNKLFGSQEHQAAGPEVLDPIIIQEGKVFKKYINQLINLHKNSFLSPVIIILLKDNDFDRAKDLLSDCPDKTNIKFIRNNGQTEICKVINTGADDIEGFINSFAMQSFSTCSKTKHDILVNNQWSENSIVRLFAPRLLRYRTNLICDEKEEIKGYLNQCIDDLESFPTTSTNDDILRKDFLCISKLFKVFCNDVGGNDINDAFNLASELGNELLLAYVYKYAYFFAHKSISDETQQLQQAYEIFKKNKIMDNAIYCKNNMLVRQFDAGSIHSSQFSDMLGEAIFDVPGLTGMSHLFNNTGVAYLMTGNPDRALEMFNKGIEHSKSSDRQVQNYAMLCNKLITKSYYGEDIQYTEISRTIQKIYDGMVQNGQLPFISSRYIMNLLIIAARQNKKWVKEMLDKNDIIHLINDGLSTNNMGSGQLLKQIDYFDKEFGFDLKSKCIFPNNIITVTGRRRDFIERTGLNPFYFFTWL